MNDERSTSSSSVEGLANFCLFDSEYDLLEGEYTTHPCLETKVKAVTSVKHQNPSRRTGISVIPEHNFSYSSKEYWDERFSEEDEYEWLMSFDDVKDQIMPYFNKQNRILIIGCGNSSFSADLYDDGFENISNIDFSSKVISNMSRKNSNRFKMKWFVMDMTDMIGFEDESFDCVIDKAGMDGLLSNEVDVWNPNEHSVAAAQKTCLHVKRILKPGGVFISISFSQPHFRKKMLLGGKNKVRNDQFSAEFQWSLKIEAVNGESGCFQNFLYIMQNIKERNNMPKNEN